MSPAYIFYRYVHKVLYIGESNIGDVSFTQVYF